MNPALLPSRVPAAVDFSHCAINALKVAAAYARHCRAELHLLDAMPCGETHDLEEIPARARSTFKRQHYISRGFPSRRRWHEPGSVL